MTGGAATGAGLPRRCWVALLLCSAATSGCQLHERYLLRARDLEAIKIGNPKPGAVAALHVQDGRHVYLRAAQFPFPGKDPVAVDADTVAVDTVQRSPMVTAGAVLTFVGTALSIFGTTGFLATNNPQGGAFHVGAGITELFGEPPQLIGTVLWIVGLARPPLEVRAGHDDLIYVGELPPPPQQLGRPPSSSMANYTFRF